MQAREIMTTTVVTVTPQTPVGELARLMTEHRISGVPVVTGDGRLLGLVSETDLLHRPETGTERRRKWWLALFQDSDMQARDYVKQHGRTAHDVMSRYVISVQPDDDLGRVADVLERNNIKRVPVLDKQGGLVGIITRGDLVRALARRQADETGLIDDVALQKKSSPGSKANPGSIPPTSRCRSTAASPSCGDSSARRRKGKRCRCWPGKPAPER